MFTVKQFAPYAGDLTSLFAYTEEEGTGKRQRVRFTINDRIIDPNSSHRYRGKTNAVSSACNVAFACGLPTPQTLLDMPQDADAVKAALDWFRANQTKIIGTKVEVTVSHKADGSIDNVSMSRGLAAPGTW